MAAVNKVLMLRGGQQEKFGLKEQIFKVGKPSMAKPQMAGPQGAASKRAQNATRDTGQLAARRGPMLSVPQGSV